METSPSSLIPSLPLRSPPEAPRAQQKLGADTAQGHTCPHCDFCRTLTDCAEMVSRSRRNVGAQPAGEQRAQGLNPSTCLLPPHPLSWKGALSADQLVKVLLMQTPSPRQPLHPSQAGGCHSILFALSLRVRGADVCGTYGMNSRRSLCPDPHVVSAHSRGQGHTHVCLGT